MKNLKLLIIPLFAACFTTGFAAAGTPAVENTAARNNRQERVEIKVEDLPEKVKKSVGYKTELAWNILKAYLVTNDDNTKWYELFVQKPDGETWIKIDGDGKVLN